VLDSLLCLVDVGAAACTWNIVMASGSLFATVAGIMLDFALISVLLLPHTMPWLAVAFFTPVVGIIIVIMFLLPMIAALLLPGAMM
jgi:hypothetical protein